MLVGLLVLVLLVPALVPTGGVPGEEEAAPIEQATFFLALLVQVVILACFTASAAVTAFVRGGPTGLRAMGLRRGGNLRAGAQGLGLYAVCYPAILGLAFLWPLFLSWLGVDVRPQAVLTTLLELRGGALAFGVLLAVLVIPLFEELVFRGFLQPALQSLFGAGRGLVLAALFFALGHGWVASVPILALALLLGWLQSRTGRLSAPCAAHMLHNGVTLLWAFLVG